MDIWIAGGLATFAEVLLHADAASAVTASSNSAKYRALRTVPVVFNLSGLILFIVPSIRSIRDMSVPSILGNKPTCERGSYLALT